MRKLIKKLICCLTATFMSVSMVCASGCNTTDSAPGTWQVNTTAPTPDSKGNVGDMWLDTSTYNIYRLTKTGWLLCGNI